MNINSDIKVVFLPQTMSKGIVNRYYKNPKFKFFIFQTSLNEFNEARLGFNLLVYAFGKKGTILNSDIHLLESTNNGKELSLEEPVSLPIFQMRKSDKKLKKFLDLIPDKGFLLLQPVKNPKNPIKISRAEHDKDTTPSATSSKLMRAAPADADSADPSDSDYIYYELSGLNEDKTTAQEAGTFMMNPSPPADMESASAE